ncbi:MULTISPECIES: primosomal protein N' [unclassified Gemella]|uniref:replication restart helicase PriA n=1 Tax=unclassified Gemella TaxID=2624949 RepID=UPI00107377FB|nr:MULTISPECIES: primosomal protein N' [unclassified Gemella]MBF0710091.1 primosomal protein N' [Gemella sp. GL1.1]MBF0746170.1 primosomal protein N' [Gemella sp. 19428wG2_WT2a]NYS27435.1 primosomal protein N' [Gemella sp. GL1]TFU60455.1 primosomal protein N' [Gemella sp. WT2a]
MFVEVIVDIKNSNLNKSYYYRVPDEYNHIKNYIGYRVEVPFGRRSIQGYIVNQKENIDFDDNKCKAINKIKDSYPVLSEELVLLSEHLSDELFCTQIQVIEAMLPTILKNKYKEYYRLLEVDEINSEYKKYFNKEKIVDKRKLDKILDQEEIMNMISKSIIKLVNLSQDQLKEDREIFYQLKIGTIIEKMTPKQKLLVDYLKEHIEIKKKEVKEILGIGMSVVRKLIEADIIKEVVKENKIFLDESYYRNSTQLNKEQKFVFDTVKKSLQINKYQDYLLHGITGSGKTEIYIKLVKECIDQGKEAIVLIPEIILTSQVENKFRRVFGDNIAVLNSKLNKKEKYIEWKKIKNSKVKICLGTRSSIFAPFENLGLIIIDEEHESTYKQQDTPRYDAKDITKKRAVYNKATVVYASATPSIDLYYEFLKKKQGRLLKLVKRHNSTLPDIDVVTLDNKEDIISQKLMQAIRETIDRGEQVLLFINKRGYTNFIRCFTCGHVYNCENCDISLNYHKKNHALRCHFCGYKKRISDINKCCDNPELISGMYGIQKIEEYLKEKLVGVKIIRMDSDTTTNKGAYKSLLQDFRDKKANILLGTQMISKGLDFPNITLVGILSVDNIVSFTTFKSNEKIFQLLVQTAGRAGRSEKKGKVIIQSNINSNIIEYAINNDYKKFYDYEIRRRELINYPPFCNISFITIKGTDENKTNQAAISIYNFLHRYYDRKRILGPSKSILYKINNEYKYNIAVKFTESEYNKLHKALKYIYTYFIDVYNKDKISLTIDNSAHDYI